MSGTGPPDSLVELTPELLELIFCYLGPSDLVHVGQTCRRAYDYIHPSNQPLWKACFLHVFDHPKHVWNAYVPTARNAIHSRKSAWNWHHELVRRMKAYQLVLAADKKAIAPEIEGIVATLLDIHQTASFTATEDPERPECPHSLNLHYLQELQRRSRDFDMIVHDFSRDKDSASLPMVMGPAEPDRPITRSIGRKMAIPEWASRFHIIHGPTEREEESLRSKSAARAIVYDWNVTGPSADYGPYQKDGSGVVNWQTVEAISSLMYRIFNTALKSYGLRPSGFDINVHNKQPLDPVIPHDWAGVTGTWVGTYAFLDYRALVHYNFAHTLEYPLDLGNYEEACGDLMRLDLTLDDSDEIKQDPRLQSDLPRCDDLPVLYFNGTSTRQPTERPTIGVRGSVCLAPGGREVRWRLVIRYAGADQWQLEGVQGSGIRSGGIIGLWSHCDHDDNGPSGPFYYAPSSLCGITLY